MNIHQAEFNNLIKISNLRNSHLELVEQVKQLANAIEKLQLALHKFQHQVEKEELKQLQIDFQNEVKSRNLEASFKETLDRLDLD